MRAGERYAEALRFPDRALDAAMAVLTLHHWADAPADSPSARE